MPVMVNEDGSVVQYVCDICGAEFYNHWEGTYCPKCGRIFCFDCSGKHPIKEVKVREEGPKYKMFEWICDLCYQEWLKKHPPQAKLDNFLPKGEDAHE